MSGNVEQQLAPARTTADADALIRRVRGEFVEMPGLRLTLRQAGRLFGMPPALCESVLAALVEERVLLRTPDGAFRLASRH
jgi:hypothetical protein